MFETQTRVATHDVVTCVCTRQPDSKRLKAEASVSRTPDTVVVAREIGTLLQSCRDYLDLMQVRLHLRSEEKKRLDLFDRILRYVPVFVE